MPRVEDSRRCEERIMRAVEISVRLREAIEDRELLLTEALADALDAEIHSIGKGRSCRSM